MTAPRFEAPPARALLWLPGSRVRLAPGFLALFADHRWHGRDAKAGARVVSQAGPAVRVTFDAEPAEYQFLDARNLVCDGCGLPCGGTCDGAA